MKAILILAAFGSAWALLEWWFMDQWISICSQLFTLESRSGQISGDGQSG